MSTWIIILLRVLASLPAIIGLIKEIIAVIQGIRDGREQRLEIKTLSANIKNARRTRNFTPIRDQLERLRKRYEQN